MKNGDTAAMPIPMTDAINSIIHAASSGDNEPFLKMMKAFGGMTKREYFAAMAMQGLCSACDEEGAWSHDAKLAACAAVEYADALLAELEKTKCAE